ncbi:hypothetical protein Tco_0379255, partial [Tanacetum coccineum]
MEFLTTAITSRFPTTNNQLRTSSNPRNQATIQNEGNAAQRKKSRRNSAWVNGDKYKSGVAESQDLLQPLDTMFAFQTDDLDAFDSDYDEALGAKTVLMANLSSYNSDVIYEVPILETSQDNSVLDNGVQEMYYSEELTFDPASDIEITSDSDIISYDQYLKETESAAVQNTTSTEQQNVVIMLYEHFGKHFVPQKELSVEQAFWLPISNPISEQLVVQPTPVKIEVPNELPKVTDIAQKDKNKAKRTKPSMGIER